MVEKIEAEYILPETGENIKLMDHQRRVLNHAFDMPDTGVRYRTVVYSCPKKSGKTEIAGAVAWAWSRLYGGLILSVANDKLQAQERMYGRLSQMLGRMKGKEPDLYAKLIRTDPTADTILLGNPDVPDSEIRAIPCDPYGEAGGHFSLTVWDELWGYRQDRAKLLWSELQPVPTVPMSMRFVTTYAGWYGVSELLWNIYEQVVDPDPDGLPRGKKVAGLEDLPCYELGSTFVYWDHECRMPWQTEKFLEEARNDPVIRANRSDYLRLWENRWTTGEESFIDIAKIDRLMEEGERMGLVNNMRGM